MKLEQDMLGEFQKTAKRPPGKHERIDLLSHDERLEYLYQYICELEDRIIALEKPKIIKP